ncbi:MAG: Crp/Fnr family transcriptional regulator, partial [Cyanobacteria bacterium K_DeepCast_35m_m1_288]|nr:Crp/Fnr family transcriptional regulator [Cyanobacteria bacterium K_DeepCast_35m_m1_288]
MTASISSRLRLLMEPAPLDRADPGRLTRNEDQVQAWQLDMGQELGAEGVPFGFVCLVVDGGLRLSGRDAMGQPFTLRRLHAGEWWGLWAGLQGVAPVTCRTTETTRLLAVPIPLWQSWCREEPQVELWLEHHPQREDLYAALRPLISQRALQDRTMADLIDQLQPSLQSAQLLTEADLDQLPIGAGTSWLLPCHHHYLAETGPPGV